MEIFGCTFSEYLEKYENRLNYYLDKWEDNTESLFLEQEHINFTDFHNVLVSIHNDLVKYRNKINPLKEVKIRPHLDYLLNNYGYVYNELFEIGPPLVNGSADYEHPDDIKQEDIIGYFFYYDITKGKLDNMISSTKRILKFINEKIKKSKTLDNVKIKAKLDVKKTESKEELENDYTKSSIEDYLSDIKSDINLKDYEILVDSLYQFFTKGKFPKLEHKIKFNSVNKKKVGWALKEAYKNITLKNLDVEYFRFAKENINLFSDEIIDKENFRQSKFYKLFTTRP